MNCIGCFASFLFALAYLRHASSFVPGAHVPRPELINSLHPPNRGLSISTTTAPRRAHQQSTRSNNRVSGIVVFSTAETKDDDDADILSTMPWGDLQSFALRDNLPKYVVTIPIPGSGGVSFSSNSKRKYGTYALWRTLLKETTELAGYDVEFVRRAYERDVKTRGDWKGYGIGTVSNDEENSSPSMVAPGVLPLLESFEFHPDGGVSGLAYGIPGIAGGSSIRTIAVSNIEKTVLLGYVETEDGSAAYELGSPAGAFYSLGSGGGDSRQLMLENVARVAGSVVQSGTAGAASAGKLAASAGAGEMDYNLVNLAGTTAALLAGATAVGMMSHHLTVNVFWV